MTKFYVILLFNDILVLRVYRKPPRYDNSLSFEVRDIIKYSLFIHFAFGFYMYSNSSIFTYSSSRTVLVPSWIVDKVNNLTSNLNNEYLSADRFSQTHSILFLLGFILYIALFIVSEVLSRMCMNCCWKCCCCVPDESLD